VPPVSLGGAGEAPLAARIRAECPDACDLTGRTRLVDLAALAAGAQLAIGNDTGPMHLVAAVGCRAIVLFSGASDPALTAPRGPDGGWPTVLRAARLDALELQTVLAAL
jgi:ADP-heptose:LPS heptosyltransferase